LRLIQDGFEERVWGGSGDGEMLREEAGREGREMEEGYGGRSPEPVFYAKLDFIQ
jgi:hypothetical protein